MDTENNYYILPSLLSLSISEVVKVISSHLNDVSQLPTNIKERLLKRMCQRGLLNDHNIGKVVTSHTRSLDLSGSSVTDRGLKTIGVCRNLRKLDMSCTKGVRDEVTAEGIQRVVQSCPLLQTVSLRRCVSIRDAAVVALAQSCPQLVELNMGGCPEITDESLVAISESCTHLRSISFSHTKVTDGGVIALARGVGQNNLDEIHMNNCIHLTNESVEAVVLFCPNVRTLIFHGCPCITERGRQMLNSMKQVTWTIY